MAVVATADSLIPPPSSRKPKPTADPTEAADTNPTPASPPAPEASNHHPTLSITTSRTAATHPKPSPRPPAAPSCLCEGCSQPHDGSYGSGRFCSVHCARRIAASRKWEKQRSERKRLAAAAASPVVDQSTSSLSSASSLDDRAALKRRRVVLLAHNPALQHAPAPAAPPHHPHPHYPRLVQPQPQHFARHHALPPQPHPMLTHMSAQRPPLAATPPLGTTPPLPATSPPFVDYGLMPVRTVSPFYTPSPPAYYPYHAPVAYTPPPQYPVYASQPTQGAPHRQLPPPPPPPTPAPDSSQALNGAQGSSGQRQGIAGGAAHYPHAPKAQVSSEKECAAIAEALLCLRKSNKIE